MALLMQRDRNVVWSRAVDLYHLSADNMRDKDFIPDESLTICGLPIFTAVVYTPDFRADVESGKKNCPKCFK